MTTAERLRSKPVPAMPENRKFDLFLWESTRVESRPVIAYLCELGPLQDAAEAVWEGEYATALREVAEMRLEDKRLAVIATNRNETRKRLQQEIADLEAGILLLTSKE